MILNNAENIMLGTSEVSRIMLGSELVWKRGGNDGKETLPLTSNYWNFFTAYSGYTAEIEDGAIHLKSGNATEYAFAHAETKKKIDLTNVRRIFVSVKTAKQTVNSEQNANLCLNTESQSEDPKGNASVYSWAWSKDGEHKNAIDVSDIVGKYYIRFYTDRYNEMYVYDITLESEENINDFDIVEYISTNANQYITLGNIVNPNDMGLQAKIALNTITADEQRILYPIFSIHNYKIFIWTKNDTNLYSNSSLSANTDYLVEYQMTENTKTVILNGNSTTGAKTLQSDSIYTTASLFGDVSQYKFNGKIYWLKIYISGELVYDFIPIVRKYDGVAGLWDNLSNSAFFSNSGTDFLAPT